MSAADKPLSPSYTQRNPGRFVIFQSTSIVPSAANADDAHPSFGFMYGSSATPVGFAPLGGYRITAGPLARSKTRGRGGQCCRERASPTGLSSRYHRWLLRLGKSEQNYTFR